MTRRSKHAHFRALQSAWGRRCSSDSRSGRLAVKGGQGRTDAEVHAQGSAFLWFLVLAITTIVGASALLYAMGRAAEVTP